LLNSEDNPRAQDSPNFDLASDIVELVVFTNDPVFMQTLREAVGGSRRLWHVPSADKVSDLLLAGQVGILVLDLQSHADAAGSFVAQIKDQFPDLVVVVAGNREAETSLAKLISDGTVYRFIHKPMSPGRARLFADAAVKKFEGRRKIAPPPPPARAAGRGADRRRVAVSLALGVAVLAAGWIAMRMLGHDQSPAPAPPPAQAVSAPAMHETTAPGTPADPRERLLVQAENALLGNRLDEAATAIGAARAAGVDSGRISFLTSQLAALRERQTHASAAARTKGDARTAGTGTATAGVAAGEAMGMDPGGNAAHAAETVDDARRQLNSARLQPDASAAGASSAPADSDAAGAAGMAADEQPQAAGIVDAGALTLVRTTKPVYPARAETGKIEGWVELEFTVTERGEVRDIKVRAANPPGVFDRAAVGALSHWRYRPVLQGEQPVAQRARIRLRFTLAG
jgi:TonB family protein